jgi:hypothetical protein
MKNIFIILLINIISVPVFSQQITDTLTLKRSNKDSAAFLMGKSDDQKTGVYILAGVGVVSATYAYIKVFSLETEPTSGPVVALSIVSVTAVIGAASLMMASKKTKAKAQSLLQESVHDIPDRSYQDPAIKKLPNRTMIIARAPFKHSSVNTLRNTSIGISQDKINLGYNSTPAKLNSLVLSISLGH